MGLHNSLLEHSYLSKVAVKQPLATEKNLIIKEIL